MKKLRVAVLCGGSSAERSISLVTGQGVYKNLDRKKYTVSLVELTVDGRFVVVEPTKRSLDIFGKDRKTFDLFFIALHGPGGEDGGVQGLFEVLGIPYTGSKVLASAMAMHKAVAGQAYVVNGLPHPRFISFQAAEWKKNRVALVRRILQEISFPLVVKPFDQGSSVGVSFPKSKVELEKVITKTLKQFPNLMVQAFIKGREATCGVLEKNGELFALPPTRIIANLAETYDFASKYKPGGSTHICPADFAPEINIKIQELAVAAHSILGCRGMSRTDIFVADNGKLYIIETNTIPGMTPTSLLPEAAGKAGITFAKMLDLIIMATLRQS